MAAILLTLVNVTPNMIRYAFTMGDTADTTTILNDDTTPVTTATPNLYQQTLLASPLQNEINVGSLVTEADALQALFYNPALRITATSGSGLGVIGLSASVSGSGRPQIVVTTDSGGSDIAAESIITIEYRFSQEQ
jgi:hypothetical protein